MGPHLAAAVAATAASLASAPAAEATPCPEHAAITASPEERSNFQEALASPFEGPTQATTPPLELSSYGWTNFFDPKESHEFMSHLRDRAPGVTFELGETRVGLTNGHLVLRGGGLRDDTSVELTTLRPGDSITVKESVAIVPGAAASAVVRVERHEGPAIEVGEGAVALNGSGFKAGFSAARDKSDPPNFPVTLTPRDNTAVIRLSHEELVLDSPAETKAASRPNDSDTARMEVGLSLDRPSLKSQTILTAEGAPNGITVDGIAPGISASIENHGGVVVAGRSRYDFASDLIVDNGTVEIAVGAERKGRCTVRPLGETPVAIALARDTDPLQATLEVDHGRSSLATGPLLTGSAAISPTDVVIKTELNPSVEPNAASIGYRYRDRIVVDQATGGFALSPSLHDTPVAVSRTGGGSTPSVEIVSNGALHGVFTPDTMLLFPPPADATRSGEVLGTVTVSGRGEARTVDVSLDKNGSLEDFGARTAELDAHLAPRISGWGSHWGTPASTLHDYGLRPGLLEPEGYRGAIEQKTNEVLPEIVAGIKDTLDDGVPRRLALDPTTGSFTAAGLGPNDDGYISLSRNGNSFRFTAENLSGPLFDAIAQTAWTLGADAKRASGILGQGNDLNSADVKTASALFSVGFSHREVNLLRTELGDILARPGIRDALNSIPFDFELDTNTIVVRNASLDFETDEDGLRSFNGSLQIEGMRVNGALPFGAVGNVAGAIVGAPGVLYDLGDGLDRATDNNPLIVPLTAPLKLVGGVFKGGELATKVVAGNVDVEVIKVQIQGYEMPSGEWVVIKEPIQLVAR